MKPSRLAALKFFALLFLLPGLAGLIFSATISAHYLDTMPRYPAPEQQRTVPRNIHGVVIYQTEQEDLWLSEIEWGSVAIFVVGLGIGLVYLEKWGSLRAREEEDWAEDAR
jgi:hypothetical protein